LFGARSTRFSDDAPNGFLFRFFDAYRLSASERKRIFSGSRYVAFRQARIAFRRFPADRERQETKNEPTRNVGSSQGQASKDAQTPQFIE
jgi:hypothetical protein